jgi:AcrR family transcriptional regulator
VGPTRPKRAPRRHAPGPERPSPGEGTRHALMDAALHLIERRGVLAGLNLQEVAVAAGVTPANVYHLFGSRQGLLRAALQRELKELLAGAEDARALSFVERRLRMFDVINGSPNLPLTALLAIDRDPDYEPLPILEATRSDYARQMAAGEIPQDVDIDALHLLSLAVSIGVAVYGRSAARQLGVGHDELQERVRSMFEKALRAFLPA